VTLLILIIKSNKDIKAKQNKYIEKIPIPLITDDNIVTVTKIEKLVNLILEKKEKDKQVDISKETDEIDKLVYQLYDLTEEEIKIVEK